MRYPSNKEELLKLLPEASAERLLLESIYELVHAVGLEHSERQGMAAIYALELSEIVFNDGRVLGADSLEAGIEDIARVVAVELHDVQPNPIAWKARYPEFIADPSLKDDAEQVAARIAKLPFIKAVR